MSKRDRDRQAAEREDIEVRVALAEQEARFEVRAELDRLHRQQLLDAARQELARDRREDEAAALDAYRDAAIAQATAAKSIAPQFVPFIGGSSREAIDNAVVLAQAKTAEIVTELAGSQGDQARDAATGRFISSQAEQPGDQYLPSGMTADEYAKAQSGSLSMQDYAAMRDRLGLGRRDAGIFG